MDNKTTKGRWNMLCLKTDYVGEELESIISHGVYECEYRKEDNIWKISNLVFNSSFQTTLKDGWANKPVIYPKTPGDVAKTWASGYKMPLHYKNPVTGK